MKNRLISLMLAALLVVSLFPLSASAADIVDSGTCGENLTWTFDSDGLLTISGTGPMVDNNDNSPFYYKRDTIRSVVVGIGVTSIGDNAFSCCSSLTNITIPEGVTSIGHGAFYSCSSLTNVTIPESVTSIGDGVFSSCGNLTSVVLPSYVNTFGRSVFQRCTNLKSVQIPNGVTTIGSNMFERCRNLTLVAIPSSVTLITNTSFAECVSLADVLYGGSEDSWKMAAEYNANFALFYNTNIHFNVTAPEAHFRPITVPATCEADGYTARTCDCGYEYDRVVTEPALGHDWTPWATLLEPTATTKGIAVRICANDPKHVEFKALPTVAGDPSNPFTDVAEGKFYHDPVLWAISQNPQITTGVTDATFEPDRSCTRAHVVTFLWRANGCPEPTSTTNTFKDVPNGKYYTKAVLWAAEQGITTGYSDGTFRPDDECSRGQVVTFLWRSKGQPKPASTTNPFSDVPAGKYYTTAVLWALENNITTGRTPSTFGPDDACTRGHVVTFLYRAYA